jgi:hypothetical protein
MIYKTTAKPGSQKPQVAGNQPRLVRSLDSLYLGRRVRIVYIDGSVTEGTVVRFTMYWLQVRTVDGRTLYVNKGSIKYIEEVGEGGGKSGGGGGSNDNRKIKQ